MRQRWLTPVVLAVLHTWNQQLLPHPHLHCVVPAGGISPDRRHWIPCRKRFFLPLEVLRRMFRGKFLAFLSAAFRKHQLRLEGALQPLLNPVEFQRLVRHLRNRNWVVYARRPFAGPRHVIQYLARYTHRVAISNGRLMRLQDGHVTFRWRDSSDGNRQKLLTLDAVEFLRRFLLHVLPRGFVKIRHFGFLANRHRREALALCHTLLYQTSPHSADPPQSTPERICPVCKIGILRTIETISAVVLAPRAFPVATATAHDHIYFSQSPETVLRRHDTLRVSIRSAQPRWRPNRNASSAQTRHLLAPPTPRQRPSRTLVHRDRYNYKLSIAN